LQERPGSRTLDGARPALASSASSSCSRARRYHRPLYTAAIAGFVRDLGVLALIVFTGLGGRLFAPLAAWPWWAGAPDSPTKAS